jgi:hypothetical protein
MTEPVKLESIAIKLWKEPKREARLSATEVKSPWNVASAPDESYASGSVHADVSVDPNVAVPVMVITPSFEAHTLLWHGHGNEAPKRKSRRSRPAGWHFGHG